MRALICGAGVAGLTLASQLGRYGCDVLLIERASAPSEGGYLVELSDEAMLVADRLGIAGTLREKGQRVKRVRWVDRLGRPVAEVDLSAKNLGYRQGALKILRGDLEKTLFDRLPANVEVRFGHDVGQVRTHPGRVDVTLKPGGHASADLLVGADGVHSQIRNLVFGDGGLWSRDLGYESAAFVFADAGVRAKLDGDFTILSVPNRHLALCPLGNGGIAATFVHRVDAAGAPLFPADRLAALYSDLGWCVPAVLEHAKAADEIHYEQSAQIKLRAWHSGRIALLGDACHAFSMIPGQGSSVAMSAAFWLGQEIVRAPSVTTAFGWYESRLMTQMATRRVAARRAANWLVPATQTELAVRNGMLRLASVPGISRLLGPVVSGIA